MKKTDFFIIVFLAVLMVTGLFSYINSYSKQVSSSAPFSLTDQRQSVDIPIIMYHGITPNAAEESEYFISTERFENDLKWLKENGYTAIFPTQLADYVKEGSKLPSNPVIISFDDGYCNNYLYAFPLLQKYNMKAVIALIGSESAGSSDDIYRDPLHCSLSWGEVSIMSKSGLIQFANHTYDLHRTSSGRKGADRKSGESFEEYSRVLTEDLTKNQNLIALASGETPIVFAWPYGAYPMDRSADSILKDIGFDITFTSYQHTSTVKAGDNSTLYGLGRFLRTPSFNIEKIKDGHL